MKKKTLIELLVMFLVGYFVYMGIEVTFRGYTYVLMGITGGIAFLLIDSINNTFSFELDVIIQCLLGSCIITGLELLIGSLWQILNLSPMWDYSSLPLNYKGVICIPFSIIWCFVSFLGILLADSIKYYLFHEDPVPYYKILKKKILTLPKRNCYVSK